MVNIFKKKFIIVSIILLVLSGVFSFCLSTSNKANADDNKTGSTLETQITLELLASDYSIIGNVKEDMYNKPLKDVNIEYTTGSQYKTLIELLFNNNTQNTTYSGKTDENGNYKITMPTAESGTITFSKTGYTKYSKNIKAEELSTGEYILNVTLHKENVKLSGQVVDKNKTPIPGANVTWVTDDGTKMTTTTNEKGEYQFETKRSIGGKLTAEYQGDTAKTTLLSSHLDKDYYADPLELNNTVIDRVNIYGQVVDKNNIPINGAEVIWVTGGKEYKTITDKNGNYSVPVPYKESGELTIIFDKAIDKSQITEDKLKTDYDNGITKLNIDSKNIEVTGKVVDKNNNPIPGAEVTYTNNEGKIITVYTDENGEYDIIIPRSTQGEIKFKYDDEEVIQSLSENDTKTDFDNGTTKLNVDINNVIIYGKVVDENNNPIQGAEVIYTTSDGKIIKGTTNENGEFDLIIPRNSEGTLTVTYNGVTQTIQITKEQTKHNFNTGIIKLNTSFNPGKIDTNESNKDKASKTNDNMIIIISSIILILFISIIFIRKSIKMNR